MPLSVCCLSLSCSHVLRSSLGPTQGHSLTWFALPLPPQHHDWSGTTHTPRTVPQTLSLRRAGRVDARGEPTPPMPPLFFCSFPITSRPSVGEFNFASCRREAPPTSSERNVCERGRRVRMERDGGVCNCQVACALVHDDRGLNVYLTRISFPSHPSSRRDFSTTHFFLSVWSVVNHFKLSC